MRVLNASYVKGGEGELSEDHPDIDNVSYEQVAMAEEVAEIQSFDDLPIFADWETDNEGDRQQGEESENHLTFLQKIMGPQVGASVLTHNTLGGSGGQSQVTGQAESSTGVPGESEGAKGVHTLR